jgi:hypothetical protein
MNPKTDEWFFKFSAAALLLTALAKLYSAGGSAGILKIQDELLHIGYRPLMVSAAVLEIAVAVFLLRSRSALRRSVAVLWLSANFIAYHIGDYWLGVHLCPCLGQLADRLPLPPRMADILLQVLAFYLFAGSVGALWRAWGCGRWKRVFSAWRGAAKPAPLP